MNWQPYLAMVAGLLLISCEKNSSHTLPVQDSSLLLEPHAITRLRRLGTGVIRLDISINGSLVLQGASTGDTQTPIELTEADFNQPDNAVQLDFSFHSGSGSIYPLASANQNVPRPAAGDRVALSGLFYRYADSDNDGLYNVHELAIEPADIDNDQLDNVNDPDSDGDGTSDGQDSAPYNEGVSMPGITALQFDLVHPDKRADRISIYAIDGIEEEVLHLINTLGTVNLSLPPLWPAAIPVEGYTENSGTAHALGSGPQSLCPDLRIGIDTSSLKSSLSMPALLYFRRHVGAVSVLPLEANEFPRLDNYQGAELDDGLRIILVPEGSVGWLELWTQQDYAGMSCALNLSTDPS